MIVTDAAALGVTRTDACGLVNSKRGFLVECRALIQTFGGNAESRLGQQVAV
jgi:hypothetical protein